MQESIIYAAYSGNETAIETNIGNYYGITLSGILNDYPGAAAGYSLRRLSATYTGSAVKVQDDVGGATFDIGFDSSGQLDTRALIGYGGSNDVFVTTWYDQSGNGNDATQGTSANRPKIYDGTTGVVTNSNGKPAIYSDDSATYQTLNSSVSGISTTFTHFSVLEPRTIKASRDAVYRVNSAIDLYGNGRIYEANGVADTAVSPAFTTGNVYIHSLDRKSSEVVFYGNGSQIGQESGAAPSNTYSSIRFFSSGNSTANTFNGYVSELIFYTASKTDDRTDIEDNINTFYNIY